MNPSRAQTQVPRDPDGYVAYAFKTIEAILLNWHDICATDNVAFVDMRADMTMAINHLPHDIRRTAHKVILEGPWAKASGEVTDAQWITCIKELYWQLNEKGLWPFYPEVDGGLDSR